MRTQTLQHPPFGDRTICQARLAAAAEAWRIILTDRVIIVVGVLVLTLLGLGILTQFANWLLGGTG
jgi:hypothetical protein